MPVGDFHRDVRFMRNVPVAMRDGVKLATSVVLPREPGRYAVVLMRTAYNRAPLINLGAAFAQRGLAFVVQDTRGRYASEGDFYPFVNEPNDGYDTIDWIAKQPWCNGRVGMTGASYLAGVQFAVAPLNHPATVALNPQFMAGDLWRTAYYHHGVFSLALTFSWLVLEVGSRTSEAATFPLVNIDRFLRELPLATLDEKLAGSSCAYYRDYVEHHTRDAFWDDQDYRPGLRRTTTPTLLTAGWYDYYPAETFRNYQALLEGDADETIKRQHRVLVGPWTHGINRGARLGDIDFGVEAQRENDHAERWLDAMLNAGDVDAFQRAPIRLFTMGENRWRDEHEWPLARTRWTRYYLASAGRANSLLGDGRLSTDAPPDAATDHYDYDPANPVPTLGGNHSVGPYNPGLYELALPGPYDQRPIERRDDVLVYTTEPLPGDLDVTGPILLHLYASSSAVDTDFVARLTDVHPDGRSINISEGVIRARFRDGEWASPSPMQPGTVYRFTIELQPTSNVFFKGHRIRLQITSSNFPLWDRNLNTGKHPGHDTEMIVASQSIHHGGGHASHLVLPVVPR